MKKIRLHTLFIIFAALLVCGCSGERHPNGQRKRTASLLTPKSSGNPYEVMVVCDDSVYQGYAGKAIQTILDKPLLLFLFQFLKI